MALKFKLITWLCSALLSTAALAQEWPMLPMPEGAQFAPVANHMVVNGALMRVQVFVAKRPPEQLAAWFKEQLGAEVQQTQEQGKLILNQFKGNFSHTVQLQTTAGGTSGWVATTQIGGEQAEKIQAQAKARVARLVSGMPQGTEVSTEVVSIDQGKNASHMVLTNPHSIKLNQDRLVRSLAAQGYELEPQAPNPQPLNIQAPRTLLFKGAQKHAIAVLSRGPEGQAMVVLNTVNETTQKTQGVSK